MAAARAVCATVSRGAPAVVDARLCRLGGGVSQRLFLLGGYDESEHGPQSSQPLLVHSSRDGSAWRREHAAGGGDGPSHRGGLACARVGPSCAIVHGGFGGGHSFSDLWRLDIVDERVAWTQLRAGGDSPQPSARSGHTATALRDQAGDPAVVIFGGYGESEALNDVHILSLSPGCSTPTWHTPAVEGSPPPARCAHTAVPTPDGASVLVFGGFTALGADGGLWLLDVHPPVVRWRELRPAPITDAPALSLARSGHASVLSGGTMVVTGGCSGCSVAPESYGQPLVLDDVLQLDITRESLEAYAAATPRVPAPGWSRLELSGTSARGDGPSAGGRAGAHEAILAPAVGAEHGSLAGRRAVRRYNHACESLSQPRHGESRSDRGALELKVDDSASLVADVDEEHSHHPGTMTTIVLVGGNDATNSPLPGAVTLALT